MWTFQKIHRTLPRGGRGLWTFRFPLEDPKNRHGWALNSTFFLARCARDSHFQAHKVHEGVVDCGPFGSSMGPFHEGVVDGGHFEKSMGPSTMRGSWTVDLPKCQNHVQGGWWYKVTFILGGGLHLHGVPLSGRCAVVCLCGAPPTMGLSLASLSPASVDRTRLPRRPSDCTPHGSASTVVRSSPRCDLSSHRSTYRSRLRVGYEVLSDLTRLLILTKR